MFTNSPGGNINFESAPFKLTLEMAELMGGIEGEMFNYYKMLMVQGLLEIRKEMDYVINLVELMLPGTGYSCLIKPKKAVDAMKQRFVQTIGEQEVIQLIDNLVKTAHNNWRTKKYDYFQNYSNGICY